jgi:hypothetical protein
MAQDTFYSDVLRFGSLRCWQRFTVTLRGREEMLVTVHACNRDALAGCLGAGGRHSSGAALPPGSPAACVTTGCVFAEQRDAAASFLLAAYSRYSSWPYVWVRQRTCVAAAVPAVRAWPASPLRCLSAAAPLRAR